jgi:hypothetical protein
LIVRALAAALLVCAAACTAGLDNLGSPGPDGLADAGAVSDAARDAGIDDCYEELEQHLLDEGRLIDRPGLHVNAPRVRIAAGGASEVYFVDEEVPMMISTGPSGGSALEEWTHLQPASDWALIGGDVVFVGPERSVLAFPSGQSVGTFLRRPSTMFGPLARNGDGFAAITYGLDRLADLHLFEVDINGGYRGQSQTIRLEPPEVWLGRPRLFNAPPNRDTLWASWAQGNHIVFHELATDGSILQSIQLPMPCYFDAHDETIVDGRVVAALRCESRIVLLDSAAPGKPKTLACDVRPIGPRIVANEVGDVAVAFWHERAKWPTVRLPLGRNPKLYLDPKPYDERPVETPIGFDLALEGDRVVFSFGVEEGGVVRLWTFNDELD